MRRHMKLVRARYVKAHHYFAAKNRAAATHKLLGRWNKAFASAAKSTPLPSDTTSIPGK